MGGVVSNKSIEGHQGNMFFFSANMLYTYHVTVAVDLLLFYDGDDKRFQRGNEVDVE